MPSVAAQDQSGRCSVAAFMHECGAGKWVTGGWWEGFCIMQEAWEAAYTYLYRVTIYCNCNGWLGFFATTGTGVPTAAGTIAKGG